MPSSIERDHVFIFGSQGVQYTLTSPVTIPLTTSVPDLTGRLVNAHDLPCYVQYDLEKSLEEFANKETEALCDRHAELALEKLRNGEIDLDNLIQQWTTVISQEVKDFAPEEVLLERDTFSDVYHTLIHSPALETLLNLEHTYALSIEDLIDQRDQDMGHLEESQHAEMEEAVRNVGITYTDDQINQLTQQHFDHSQLIEGKWASEIGHLKATQKREYREWVMCVSEDSKAAHNPGYVQRLRGLSSNLPVAEASERSGYERLEESFTIHLGAQMKTTHNLRLLCADALDLCRHKHNTVGGAIVAEPQRLQTAMSLYSNSLCGIVLLVDNRLNMFTGIKRDFAKVCERSTDFHFDDLQMQFSAIESEVVKANEWRQTHRLPHDENGGDHISVQSAGSGSSDVQQDKSTKLFTGDFYITHHSNLSEVHAVFHLITDDSVRSSELTSRHPVILTLRNILKICFRYDIHTLTIPLLLSLDMTEEMTIPWCLKRAELIFKCVKGFMMEMSTWGEQQSRTVQFLVPRNISEEMFSNISTMLPQIFRLSNPVVAKSS